MRPNDLWEGPALFSGLGLRFYPGFRGGAMYVMTLAGATRKNCGGVHGACSSCSSRSPGSCSHTMTLTSTNDYASIFKDGKLKPGVYKIQNIVSQTYVDIREHTRELCCRPAAVLEGNGLVSPCPHLAHAVVIVIIFSGKFSRWVLGIPYTRCGRGSCFARFKWTERHNTV